MGELLQVQEEESHTHIWKKQSLQCFCPVDRHQVNEKIVQRTKTLFI